MHIKKYLCFLKNFPYLLVILCNRFILYCVDFFHLLIVVDVSLEIFLCVYPFTSMNRTYAPADQLCGFYYETQVVELKVKALEMNGESNETQSVFLILFLKFIKITRLFQVGILLQSYCRTQLTFEALPNMGHGCKVKIC